MPGSVLLDPPPPRLSDAHGGGRGRSDDGRRDDGGGGGSGEPSLPINNARLFGCHRALKSSSWQRSRICGSR